jgi:hypothetical protein
MYGQKDPMPGASRKVRRKNGLPDFPHAPLPERRRPPQSMPEGAAGKTFVGLIVVAWVIFMVWLISGMVASR